MAKWIVLGIVGMLLALAGGAGAAQLITGKQVKNGSLTGKDIRNRSVTAADLRGPVPISLSRIDVVYSTLTVAPGGVEILTVSCDPGRSVVSGGWSIIGGDTTPFVDKSYDDVSWSVGIDNFNSSLTADAEVYAYCAKSGQAMSAGRSDRRVEIRRDVAAQRASHR